MQTFRTIIESVYDRVKEAEKSTMELAVQELVKAGASEPSIYCVRNSRGHIQVTNGKLGYELRLVVNPEKQSVQFVAEPVAK